MTVKEALKDLTKKYNITIEVAVDNALDSDKDKGYAINFNYHITKWLGLTKTFYIDTPGYNGTKDYKCSSDPVCIELLDSGFIRANINKKYITDFSDKMQKGYEVLRDCAAEFTSVYKASIVKGLKSGEIK